MFKIERDELLDELAEHPLHTPRPDPSSDFSLEQFAMKCEVCEAFCRASTTEVKTTKITYCPKHENKKCHEKTVCGKNNDRFRSIFHDVLL